MQNQFLGLLLFLLCCPTWGQGFDLPGMKSPWGDKKILRMSQSRNPDRSQTFNEQNPGTSESDVLLAIPLTFGEKEGLRFSAQYHRLGFEPQFSDLPDLSSLEFGISYSRPLSEAATAGLTLRHGSASDRIFSAPNVTFTSATATWVTAKENDSQWVWLLNYSNNRPFLNNIPLPGFAYVYSPHSNFHGVFGFPFAFLQWKWTPDWGAQLFSILPWHLKTSVIYQIRPYIPLSLGLDLAFQTYFLADRSDPRERLFFEERKVFVGIRSPLASWLMVEAECGQSFDRRAFRATEYRPEIDNALRFGPRGYVRLGLMLLTD